MVGLKPLAALVRGEHSHHCAKGASFQDESLIVSRLLTKTFQVFHFVSPFLITVEEVPSKDYVLPLSQAEILQKGTFEIFTSFNWVLIV